MKVRIKEEDDLVVVHPFGKLDGIGAKELESSVEQVLANSPGHVVIDMSDVPFVSSAGLRVFIVAARALRGKGQLTVSNPNQVVREVFTLAGFERVLNICEDLASAKALKA